MENLAAKERTKILRTGRSEAGDPGFVLDATKQAGFTLIELLLVMTMLGLVALATAPLLRTRSDTTDVKSSAQILAARLRAIRSVAIRRGTDHLARIYVNRRLLTADDGGPNLQFAAGIQLKITAALSERTGGKTAGIRFYPNGSSTGGTIRITSGASAHEVRVNWLTGRVLAQQIY